MKRILPVPIIRTLLSGIALVAALSVSAMAADIPAEVTLFKNVNVFDGVNEALIENANVVVTDNLITAISTEPLAVAGGRVIDGGGRTLMPGMIDVHWHTYYANIGVGQLLNNSDMSDVAIAGLLGNEQVLMRGFTTVRDIGGNPFAVKKAIDAGKFPGPRMLVSGPPLGQSGGHFDLMPYSDVPRQPSDSLSYWERNGLFALADGVPDVTRKAREILRLGATQIKIAGGGGVSSTYDPLDVTQFSFEEMKAIVGVAANWNTYVAAHIFTDEAIQTAIRAGVKTIEHGNLIMKKETLQMMKDNGVWLSAQPLIDDEDRLVFDNPTSTAKWIAVTDGTGRNYAAAKAGMIGFSKSLAREVGSRGITVNVVAPGFIVTDMTDALGEGTRDALLSQVPLGRLGSPEDIAHAVAFLASPEAGYITGETLHVNGGMYMI